MRTFYVCPTTKNSKAEAISSLDSFVAVEAETPDAAIQKLFNNEIGAEADIESNTKYYFWLYVPETKMITRYSAEVIVQTVINSCHTYLVKHLSEEE